MPSEKLYLTRGELAQYLTANGYPILKVRWTSSALRHVKKDRHRQSGGSDAPCISLRPVSPGQNLVRRRSHSHAPPKGKPRAGGTGRSEL